MVQKALITGATSGIGKELAILMAKSNHDLVLVARNKDNLLAVKNEIKRFSSVNVSIYQADLSQNGSAAKLFNETKKEGIEILINNAGVGLKGDFFHDDLSKTIQIAQLNMISLTELSHLYGNYFLKQNSGKILNIGSIAAFLPGPKQAVYYATKSFVRNLSRSLAYNLRNSNVTVTTLHPGVTKTNFFNASGATNFSKGAPASSVAALGYKAMMNGKIEVTYGLFNKFLVNFVLRFIPYKYQAYLVDNASEI